MQGVTFKTEEERDSAILNLVNIAGTHVMFENQEIVAYNALVNPALKQKVNSFNCREILSSSGPGPSPISIS